MTLGELSDADLEARWTAARSAAARLLGQAVPERLDATIAALMAVAEEPESARQEAHRARLAALRADAAQRERAATAVEAAAAQLAERTVPAAMLTAAPAALANACTLGRVLVSRVSAGVLEVHAAVLRGDARASEDLLARLQQEPVTITPPLLEAEVIRRRRAMLVEEAGAVAWRQAAGWSSVVVAPVSVRASVIALIHADRGTGESKPTPAERDLVALFADIVARAYERAVLRRRLRAERSELHDYLADLEARSASLADDTIALEGLHEPAAPAPSPIASADPGAARRRAFDSLLTRRELEVLTLLVAGASNQAIADALVLSPGTVKFHVNNLLRKLRAPNRAAAAARYHALVNAQRRAG